MVGLGNPGQQYSRTRHNLGWMFLDQLASDWQINTKLKAALAQTVWRGDKLWLVKPQTYMNRSGEAVRRVVDYYQPDKPVVVVHDDADLALGRWKLQLDGRSAGHRGVESVYQHYPADQVLRLRLGVGRPDAPLPHQLEDWVLQPFTAEQWPLVQQMLQQALEELQTKW